VIATRPAPKGHNSKAKGWPRSGLPWIETVAATLPRRGCRSGSDVRGIEFGSTRHFDALSFGHLGLVAISIPEPLWGKDRLWPSYQGRPRRGQPFARAEAPSGQNSAVWRIRHRLYLRRRPRRGQPFAMFCNPFGVSMRPAEFSRSCSHTPGRPRNGKRFAARFWALGAGILGRAI
jgi:hypothetical protein